MHRVHIHRVHYDEPQGLWGSSPVHSSHKQSVITCTVARWGSAWQDLAQQGPDVEDHDQTFHDTLRASSAPHTHNHNVDLSPGLHEL